MAPLSDIINRFDAPPDAVLAILDFWQQRGHLRRIVNTDNAPAARCSSGGCGSGSCGSDAAHHCETTAPSNALIEWIEPNASPVCFDAVADFEAAWLPASPRKPFS
jgi:hypothetical protein